MYFEIIHCSIDLYSYSHAIIFIFLALEYKTVLKLDKVKYGILLSILTFFVFPFQFSSVQSLRCVCLFVSPWTVTRQAFLSITDSRSLIKLMPIESVMPSNHLFLCCPLLLPPSIFPSNRVFSNESVLCSR